MPFKVKDGKIVGHTKVSGMQCVTKKLWGVFNKRGKVINYPIQIGDDTVYIECIFAKKSHARIWATGNTEVRSINVEV